MDNFLLFIKPIVWEMNKLPFKNVSIAHCPKLRPVRYVSTLSSIQRTTAPALVYRLTSKDPFLNLSIENYIFRKAPTGTKVLLFYVNRPCIVLGRNQNPWLEVNLHLLRTGISDPNRQERRLENVDLVRRRSGGGTVFHDEGNVNWSVICDASEFTRDKHAEMVVRGLRDLGIERARVNERHDIVLDQGNMRVVVESNDTHVTPFGQGPTPLKVSGSAYKLARGRALHHGTALVGSENLKLITRFLRSPGQQYITAKGVDSVRSPITNLNISEREFCDSVETQFRQIYGTPAWENPVVELGPDCLDIKEISEDYAELTSDKWKFLQTPQFNFQISSSTSGDFELNVKHGIIMTAKWTLPDTECMELDLSARGIALHKLGNWKAILSEISSSAVASHSDVATSLAGELTELMPRPL